MLIPKLNGRQTLLENVQSRFADNPNPTLAAVIGVVQDATTTSRIEDTSHQLVIEAWPMGGMFRRTIDVAVCIGLGWDDDKWEEPPGQIVVNYKTHGGLLANLIKRHSGFLDTEQIDHAERFLDAFRASSLFRLYANKPATEFAVSLWGGDDFFDMMAKVLPAMKKAGLINCCDGACDVADENHNCGEPSDEPKSRSPRF